MPICITACCGSTSTVRTNCSSSPAPWWRMWPNAMVPAATKASATSRARPCQGSSSSTLFTSASCPWCWVIMSRPKPVPVRCTRPPATAMRISTWGCALIYPWTTPWTGKANFGRIPPRWAAPIFIRLRSRFESCCASTAPCCTRNLFSTAIRTAGAIARR